MASSLALTLCLSCLFLPLSLLCDNDGDEVWWKATAYNQPSIAHDCPFLLELMIYASIVPQKYSKTHMLMGKYLFPHNIFIVGVELSQVF